MLAEAQPYMRRVPSLTLIPGAAIFVTALSVTLLGQSLMLRTQLRAWRPIYQPTQLSLEVMTMHSATESWREQVLKFDREMEARAAEATGTDMAALCTPPCPWTPIVPTTRWSTGSSS